MDDDGCGGDVVATTAVVDLMLDRISGSGGSDAGWDAGLDAGSELNLGWRRRQGETAAAATTTDWRGWLGGWLPD